LSDNRNSIGCFFLLTSGVISKNLFYITFYYINPSWVGW
jgi:hypothetical protein